MYLRRRYERYNANKKRKQFITRQSVKLETRIGVMRLEIIGSRTRRRRRRWPLRALGQIENKVFLIQNSGGKNRILICVHNTADTCVGN